MQLSKFTKLAAAAAILMGAASASHALMRLSITDGNSSTAISCTTPASCSTAGFVFTTVLDVPGNHQIFFNTITPWNGWAISGTVAFSDSPGSVTTSKLNVSSLVVTNVSGAANFLDLSLVGTDYTIPTGNLKSISGTATISSQEGDLEVTDTILSKIHAAGDNRNVGFDDASTLIDSCTTGGPAGVTISKTCDMAPQAWTDTDGGTFSMRVFQRISLSAGASVKADSLMVATSAAVPEPMTVSLVGAALLGVAAASRRRANKA
jgi:hypothetical protein